MIGGFALTEALAGSDSFNLRTRAKRDGSDWVINGEKLWITNGGIADVLSVLRGQNGELQVSLWKQKRKDLQPVRRSIKWEFAAV